MAVDRQRQQAQAVRPGDLPVSLVPVVLDADGGGAARPEGLADQGQPVAETGADHDAVAGDADAARPGQVTRERRPQLRQAARVRVAQDVARGGGHARYGSPPARPARGNAPRSGTPGRRS